MQQEQVTVKSISLSLACDNRLDRDRKEDLLEKRQKNNSTISHQKQLFFPEKKNVHGKLWALHFCISQNKSLIDYYQPCVCR